MTEYAFDITLYSVASVSADTEEEARRMLNKALDCIDLMYSKNGVLLTETSLAQDLEPVLYLMNGKEISAVHLDPKKTH